MRRGVCETTIYVMRGLLIGGALAVSCTAPGPTVPAVATNLTTTPPSAAAATSVPAATVITVQSGPIQLLTPSVGWVITGAGLERTADGGVTWRVVNATESFAELRFVDEQRGWAAIIAAPAGRSTHASCANVPLTCFVIATTADGGATWVDRYASRGDQSGPPVSIQAIDASIAWAMIPKGRCDQGGCVSELRKTTDGGATWTTQRTGRLGHMRMASASQGWLSVAAIGDSTDVYVTSDGGTNWTHVLATRTGIVAIDAASESDAWVLSLDGGTCTSSSCASYELQSTNDGGASWTTLGNPKALACGGGHLAGPVFAGPMRGWFGNTLGAGGANGTGGIMRTDDRGRTWTCATTPTNVGEITAADSENVWARSDRHEGPGVTAFLYASSDGGKIWRRIR